MMTARVAVEVPPASAMNCEDARDGLSALAGGPIGLTEWALLEVHLKHCAPCRQAEADLRHLAAASHPVTPPRVVLASLRKGMEIARIGATCSTALVVRRRVLRTAAAREFTSRVTAGVMRADLVARIRASPASAHALAARTFASALEVVAQAAPLRASLAIPLRSSVAVVNALETVRRNISRSVKRTIRFRPSVQALGAVLALAFTLCALQGTDGPQHLARPPAPPPPGLERAQLESAQVESARLEPTRVEPTRLEPAQAEPAQPAPSMPVPSVEKKAAPGTPPRTDERRHAPSETPPRAAALSSPDASASEPVREVSEPPASPAHVVGRLTSKKPRAAQRDLIALLADVGGAELGRSHRVRFTAVEVVVPQSRYDEFADGLARIGSWRLEAARFPLPDAVHMIIRVTE